jgi:hypothetical protein
MAPQGKYSPRALNGQCSAPEQATHCERPEINSTHDIIVAGRVLKAKEQGGAATAAIRIRMLEIASAVSEVKR